MINFQIFLQNEKSDFFDFEINPSFGLSQIDNFLTKFKQNLSDENQWPKDHKLQSENDPLKSIFDITHKGKKLTHLPRLKNLNLKLPQNFKRYIIRI